MSYQSKKVDFGVFSPYGTITLTFVMANSSTSIIAQQLAARSNSFYGAVFNALDDLLRKGHAYALPQHAIKTRHFMDGDFFCFKIQPSPKDDSCATEPAEAANLFLRDIYDIMEINELYEITRDIGCDQKTGEYACILRTKNPLQLMKLMEELLRPYDIEDGFLPTLRHSNSLSQESISFSLFPQYSLKHIRAMFHLMQGKSCEGQGMQLNH